MSSPWLVKAAAWLKKREKEDLCEVRDDKGRWKETGWCDTIKFLQEPWLDKRTTHHWWRMDLKSQRKKQINRVICCDLPHMEKGIHFKQAAVGYLQVVKGVGCKRLFFLFYMITYK